MFVYVQGGLLALVLLAVFELFFFRSIWRLRLLLVVIYSTANQCYVVWIQWTLWYRTYAIGYVACFDRRAILQNEIRFACTLQSAFNHLCLLEQARHLLEIHLLVIQWVRSRFKSCDVRLILQMRQVLWIIQAFVVE